MRLKHLSATSCEARIRTPSVLRWESTVPLPENLESPCSWHCTVPSMALDESGSPPAFRSPYVLPYGLAPASCVLRAEKHHVVGSSSSSLFWLDVNVCIAYDITCAGTQETGKWHGKQFGARLFKLDEVISVADPMWACQPSEFTIRKPPATVVTDGSTILPLPVEVFCSECVGRGGVAILRWHYWSGRLDFAQPRVRGWFGRIGSETGGSAGTDRQGRGRSAWIV
ncbi:hypothetical protein VFPFJ_10318 [Purpureocillium lilacinum]|uniref:Uncharacterized protein n=1 Tax=Purpureocillium lilacinum TaxID=33203 RepID=A0A179GKR9_PURLI|nr:hypothetical protein VFPFJ_10318 [Purpureocillium lilacinum]OAQ77951.1 hypothetical protein VFPFJ_10318 [Purpureocillium lilacinum]